MKNLKSKLLASVAMLIVSGVMLTSASFAWFTISTAPEISNIHTTVTANGNLEIALDNGGTPPESTYQDGEDGGKNETWGNLVDLAAYFNAVNVELKPVDVAEVADGNIAAGTVRIPTWGLDGRISGLETADVTSVTDGSNYTDLTGLYIYTDGDETNPVTYALRVDFWLRSNVGGKVILTEAVDRGPNATAENNNSMGLGSYLEGDMAGKISVAFQPGGTGTLTKATSTIDADDTGIYNLSADAGICTLTENVPQKVSMYIYMDGADLKNKDFLNQASTLLLNVQFALEDKTLDAMDVTASGNGRDSITLHTPTTPSGDGSGT